MKQYEGYFILPPEAAADVRKNQLKALEDLIRKFNGRVHQKVEMGKRWLGYPIRKFKEGYAVVVDFDLESKQQDELRRALELHEDIVKYMITRKETQQQEKIETRAAAAAPKTAVKKTGHQEQSAAH